MAKESDSAPCSTLCSTQCAGAALIAELVGANVDRGAAYSVVVVLVEVSV